MTEVSYGIHWGRFSLRQDHCEVMTKIGGAWSTPLPRGGFSHPCHVLHDTGAKLFFGGHVDQPRVLEVPGQTCESHAKRFCDVAHEMRGLVTRFDIAVDVQPAELTMERWEELRQAFRSGQCDTRVPKTSFKEVRSDRPGEGNTAYFGSRQSEQFTRAYTRRGPLRIELEIKPQKPLHRSAWSEMLAKYQPAELFRALGKQIIWPFAWYHEILEGSAVELPGKIDKKHEFRTMVDNAIHQFGPTLWSLVQVGFPIEQLARAPANPDGLWLEKQKLLAAGANEYGYNGDRLCEQAKEHSKSRRPHDSRATHPRQPKSATA